MDRRGFLGAAGAVVSGGCVTGPVSSRPTDISVEEFERVFDLAVGPDQDVYVSRTESGGAPSIVAVDGPGSTVERFTAERLRETPYLDLGPTTLFVDQGSEGLLAVDRETLSVRWRRSAASASWVPEEDGVAYLGVEGRVVAADVGNGKARWSYDPPPDRDVFAHSIVGRTVICVGGGGQITGLSIDDGTERWAHALGGGLPIAVSGDDDVYVGTGTDAEDPRAAAIDAASGDVRWTVRAGDSIVSPNVGPRNVYLPNDDSRWGAVAVDSETGEERWRRAGVSVSHVGPPGPIGRAGPADIVALDPATGEGRWRFRAETWDEAWPEVELIGRTLLVVDPGSITAIDVESGRPRWRHRADLASDPLVEAAGSVVAVASGGRVLGFRLGGRGTRSIGPA